VSGVPGNGGTYGGGAGGGGENLGSTFKGGNGIIIITYTPAATTVQVKHGGIWKRALSQWVKDGGVWKSATVSVKDAGTWKPLK
jgi:hypothetical protein